MLRISCDVGIPEVLRKMHLDFKKVPENREIVEHQFFKECRGLHASNDRKERQKDAKLLGICAEIRKYYRLKIFK
jgi:hypothetical protein